MKLLGLNISISRASQKEITPPATRSAPTPAALQWLSGDDNARSIPLVHNPFEQVPWVYRCATALAEQIANTPFLFSRGERGRESLITSGPLIDFYNRPSPQLNRFQYWESRVLWLLLRGECFRIPVYSEGFPRKLQKILFLDPARLQSIINDHELVGWRFTAYNEHPLPSQIFLPEEVWFDKLPNPFSPWRGLSPLTPGALAVSADHSASWFMRNLVENNAEGGLIIRAEQSLTDEQRAQIAAAIRNRRASGNSTPVLLWGATEVIKPSLSSADLQFLENRKFTRSEICAAFGVPEEIVSTSDHNKYDVMQGARLNFIENRVAPFCARLAAEEQHVIRSIEPNAVGWFDIDSLPIMQEARRNRLAAAKAGFDMGIPFNELNRVLDLGFRELPWGNMGYVSGNLSPAGMLPPH